MSVGLPNKLNPRCYKPLPPPTHTQHPISDQTILHPHPTKIKEKRYDLSSSPLAMANRVDRSGFHDYLPAMAEKLGGEGLIGELCNGFNLLMDSDKGVITFDSLKRNSALLGLQDLSDDDLRGMLKEGDFDGDGALNQMEFCVLMFRLSPELMEESEFLLEKALRDEFLGFHSH